MGMIGLDFSLTLKNHSDFSLPVSQLIKAVSGIQRKGTYFYLLYISLQETSCICSPSHAQKSSSQGSYLAVFLPIRIHLGLKKKEQNWCLLYYPAQNTSDKAKQSAAIAFFLFLKSLRKQYRRCWLYLGLGTLPALLSRMQNN